MKRTIYSTATFMCLAALFAFASYQKKQNVKTLFTGTIEQPTSLSKTSVEIESATGDAVVKWEEGDEIAVYDPSTAHTLVATPTGDYTTADFSGIADLSDGPYYAIYPASIATSATSITLSTEQTCSNGTHFTAPMYAYSSTSKLVFKNLCGVLQLNLPAMNKTIASIELTTPNNNICGDFAIDYNDGDPRLNCTANGGHKLTLNCGKQGMDCSQGLTFYIYLPADDYTNMTFAIEATDRSCCLKHFEDADNPITIVRNTYYPTTLSNLSFLPPAQMVNGAAFSRGVQTLNLSGATTSSSLKNATSMFMDCTNLSGTLDLSGIELSTIIEWWYKEGIFRNTATNASLTVLCTQNTYNALNDGHSSDYGLAGNNHITLQVVE